jgi:hypothetical protein
MNAPRAVLVLLLAVGAGCRGNPNSGATGGSPQNSPLPDGPGTRVLFIGNSHTGANNLPAVVEAMAKAAGRRVLQRRVIMAGTSLQDHLNRGAAQQVLTGEKWDFVVLQQGPSSLPASREELKQSAGEWGRLIRAHGAKPAFFMVWPVKGQPNGFELVARSYREGAASAEGVVFAAGEAWQAALADDPTLPLYESDGSHATEAGSYLAGLVITHGLVGVRPAAVPAKLDLGGGYSLEVPEALAAKLRRAAESVLDRTSPAK